MEKVVPELSLDHLPTMDGTVLNQPNEENNRLIKIERHALNQDQLDDNYHIYKPQAVKGIKGLTHFISRNNKKFVLGYWSRLRAKTRKKCVVGAAPAKQCLSNLFPIVSWLPKYSWKNDFIYDIMSGCTVAVMHIPQGSSHTVINFRHYRLAVFFTGMGYALLGSVAPIVGIYMAFFPVLVYVFLGTSHHISLGIVLISFFYIIIIIRYSHKVLLLSPR